MTPPVPTPADVADLEPAPPSGERAAGESAQSIATLGIATDTDASLRFAQRNAQVLRYAPGIGWIYWDGARWKPDGEGRAIELSKNCARAWVVECARTDNLDLKRAAIGLESSPHVRAAVDLARSDPRLIVTVDRLDRDPWLLNVLNGTIDLRTGKLRDHSRDDFITKMAPVMFMPEAQHPILIRYLQDVEKGCLGMSAFLARCFGAALTGDAEAESLFLLQGDAASGKTTLAEAVAGMLGDYAVKLRFESFCLSKFTRGAGAASPDLIPLRGSRFAYASEGDQSARLDAGVVKSLTGNEPITARALYMPPITFVQTWKLWLVSNFDPKCDAEDTGIWRRMIKLHFAAIPQDQRDPAVKRALTTDPDARSALLAWAIKGCLDWQGRGGGRQGLAPPDAVQAATDGYRAKMDTLGQWWADLVADSTLYCNAFTPTRDLRGHYERWCEEEGALPVQSKRFNAYLEAKELVRGRGTGGVKGWRGIKLAGE